MTTCAPNTDNNNSVLFSNLAENQDKDVNNGNGHSFSNGDSSNSASSNSNSIQSRIQYTPRIGTHDGKFHCDEALACWMLKQTAYFKNASIVRSRDATVLADLDILVDVGGKYNPYEYRFDHHQREFEETFTPSHNIKLSSAGLVYKHFGQEVLELLFDKFAPPSASGTCYNAILENDRQDQDDNTTTTTSTAFITAATTSYTTTASTTTTTDPQQEKYKDKEVFWLIYYKLYNNFILPLDAIDNGIPQFYPPCKPVYRIQTDLASRIDRLNPWWNEQCDESQLNARFARAMDLAGEEFVHAARFLICSWLPARQIVQRAMQQRFSVHPSGQVVVLSEYTVWKNHLFALEEEEMRNDNDNNQITLNGSSSSSNASNSNSSNNNQFYSTAEILYVLYPDVSGQYRIQAVSQEEGSFESRQALPERWRGLQGAELQRQTGVRDAIFCHSSGFIGGAATLDGAKQMALAAL
jgi:uncharacterized UPF0160 family protein